MPSGAMSAVASGIFP